MCDINIKAAVNATDNPGISPFMQDIRISTNWERTIQKNIAQEKPHSERLKERWSFKFTWMQVDLTKVINKNIEN
jgi:hypothetical protein